MKVQQWLQQAKRIVVLTGAGMSTESGIPDFRSKEGRWRNIDPMTVATTDAYAHNYDLFYDFYRARKAAVNCLSAST
ncbi:MAG: Sir2 family NAD-dependent protein deacetylase [Caryophanon sp.]|nr:Sir2 family NAD-dependent protein deacetylase [Caryophanon sp.]